MSRPGISILLLFVCCALSAQQYNLKTYTIEDGLPLSQVVDILQDRKGYLWIATKGGGAARFDGHKFTVFTTEDGLCDNNVFDLLEDSRGNIWFATPKGICRYNHFSFSCYGEKDGIPSSVLTIAEDDKGGIWIGSEKQGLFRFHGGKSASLTLMDKGRVMQNVAIRTIRSTPEGMWIGTDAGAFHISDSVYRHYHAPEYPLCGNGVWAISRDHLNNIWLGTFGNGVSHFNGKEFRTIVPNAQMNTKMTLHLFEDKQKCTWVGTDGDGLYKISNKHADSISMSLHLHEGNGLPSNRVRCVFQDNENNIWIGTDGGLSRFDGGLFTTYTVNDGLKSKFVYSFLEDEQKNILIGTQVGLNCFNGKTIIDYPLPLQKFDMLVWSMHLDRKKNLWVGTYLGGSYKFRNNSVEQFSTMGKGLSNNVIYAYGEDSKGMVWLGTDYGIAVYDGQHIQDLNERNAVTASRVRSIHVDRKDQIWFGTRKGLIKYTPSGEPPVTRDFIRIPLSPLIDDNVIYDIAEDDNGYLWFATDVAGVVRYSPSDNTCKTISKPDGLGSNVTLSLLIDGPYLWIGTVNGIHRLEYTEYNKSGTIKLRHFGKAEGFSGIEVNQGAVLKTSAGTLWFGTSAGAVCYNPLLDRENKLPPSTLVGDIRLFFEKPDWSLYCQEFDSISNLPLRAVFPYDQNHLTFDFTAICLSAPEKVRYQYMLKGLDKEWSPVTTQRYASYPSLPDGEYTFYVKACNNEGVWCPEPVAFSFNIQPPVWKRGWFFGLVSFTGIGIFMGISALRTRNLRLAKKRLEGEVLKRTQELFSANETLTSQNRIIEEKNKDITDSIYYAKHIQDAIFPHPDRVKEILPEAFIFFQPREILSGDFYWMEKASGKSLVAAVDCTGHGVPGAIMSIIGNTALNQAVKEHGYVNPADILEHLGRAVLETLNQKASRNLVRDGMDIALLSIDYAALKLEYAGAKNPVYIVRKNAAMDQSLPESYKTDNPDLLIIKSPNIYSSVGGYNDSKTLPFETRYLQLKKGDCLYILSDGYADQFGGEKNQKFRNKNFQKLLVSMQNQNMESQKQILEETFRTWKGNEVQTDDVLVIGIRI